MQRIVNKGGAIAASQDDQDAEEDRLILLAQEDLLQFHALYDLWITRVYQYVYSRVGVQQDAEDITSQIFLNAYQAFPRYRHKGMFSAWLFTIARNQVKRFYRAQTWRNLPLEAVEQGMRDPGLEQVDQAEEIERLSKLIGTLPAEEQELIRLRYIAELKFSQIASVLNRREDAVKKMLYRLQQRLQKLLEDQHE